jgi:hypothetical protein
VSELVWLRNPGNLGADGSGWSDWAQFKVADGPDVMFKMETLEADDGVTYEVSLDKTGQSNTPNWKLCQLLR